jgi:hypothetical protein
MSLRFATSEANLPKSSIPFGSEFGPNQVDLLTVLQMARTHAGDGAGFTNAIAHRYGWPPETAKNTRLGMQSYHLFQGDRLTALGEELLALASTPERMYEAFARHILLNLHGLEVVTAIDAMLRLGETPTLASLSTYLKPLGLYVPTTGTHLSKLRGWLALAGVFTEERGFASLNMARVRELLGLHDDAEIDILAELPDDQRSFLKALANMPMADIPDTSPLLASDVVDYAATLYGTVFNEKNLVRMTLLPLQEAGFITIDKPPKATGEEAGKRRIVSGKSSLIFRTEKFANDCLIPLIDRLAGTGLAVRQLMRKPLRDILTELASADRNIKGKALEALAFYFTRLLDLEFRAWRHRGKETGGAEVDVLVEGARLLFSRWQIQCKNTETVSLDDVAKEVGVALGQLKSNVVMVITTGRLVKDARTFAEDTMRSTHLNIIAIERRDLAILVDSPPRIAALLNEKARQVMETKALSR